MTGMLRRDFLTRAGSTAAAVALARGAAAAAADERVVVAVIGTGGMGSGHVRELARRDDVELAAVCDVDRDRLAAAVRLVTEAGKPAPQAVGDLRHVLDDRRIDAVWIATPDHWHAPAAILALDAGKHVYVEKPCCHTIREGRLLAAAVARSGRHLQVGTQSRSSATVRAGIGRILDGEIGDVLVSKAWNSQRRGSIGRSEPSTPPAQLDFEGWLGPAPPTDYRSNLLPGVWRWWYDFGCGDMGNDGVHDIDVALWGLGVTEDPTLASCFGRKLFFDDDQQFPDTQYAVFEFPGAGPGGQAKQMIFEQRIWSPYVQEGYENGAAFYGTEGMLVMGHSVGWKLYGPRNKLLAEETGGAGIQAHHDDFLGCIRGDLDRPSADVRAGVQAATLVHLANISARVGRTLAFDREAGRILDDPEADALVTRRYRDGHWAVPREG